MNKKKKSQLMILCAIFLLLAAALAVLKVKNENEPAEGMEDDESYQVLGIDPLQVKEIGIIGSEGTVNLVKAGDEWKCLEDEGATIDKNSVEIFLEKASSIVSDTKIEQVTDMEQYGLENPAVSVTLQWDDNMYIIRFGDYNSMINSYYLSVNEQNIVYTADSSLYYSFNKTLEDFKAVEEISEEEQAEE